MWIILLDSSGSMADPFSGDAPAVGRQRTSQQKSKMEAAKESLLLQLSGLGPPTEISLFAFRGDPQLIFQGLSSETRRIEAALNTVQPLGRTNVAAALQAAGRLVRGRTDVLIARVLLISDGLSDASPAEQEARALQRDRIPVDVILIDPSEEGSELCRRVAGSTGAVTSVVGGQELHAAVGVVSEAVAAQAQVSTRFHQEVQAAVNAQAGNASEPLSFTVAHPSELTKDALGKLIVYLHLESLTQEARDRAVKIGGVKGADALSGSQKAVSRVPRGTTLVITPRLDGFAVNPTHVTIAWW